MTSQPEVKTDGRLVVVSGPSGAGKTSVLNALIARPGFRHSVSVTTRPIRAGEKDGYHYTFVEDGTFQAWVDEGRFLEHATVHGNRYGTLISAVLDIIGTGQICLLDIDVQGGRILRERGLDCTFVFVAPPSLEILEQRLRTRGTDSEEAIERRLHNARQEMEEGKLYDLMVVNEHLDTAVETVVEFLAERDVAPETEA